MRDETRWDETRLIIGNLIIGQRVYFDEAKTDNWNGEKDYYKWPLEKFVDCVWHFRVSAFEVYHNNIII